MATVNGVGELTKKLEIDEWGIIQTAIYLCGTHALGIVYHAAVIAEGGDPSNTLIPVVGECDDSDLADSRTVAWWMTCARRSASSPGRVSAARAACTSAISRARSNCSGARSSRATGIPASTAAGRVTT